ncbi:MAG: polyprenyl synthetase family protein [Clostridiales bacterium]|nr:polyprenyl synthetase family protein [Clostridiales bacterium]
MKEKLAWYANRIEEALSGYILEADGGCFDSRRAIDVEADEQREGAHPALPVAKAMRYSLLGGGKRVRGALVMSLYHLYHEDVEAVLPFACAIEMIHAYSLIHDDLPCMDDDHMRRGKPSCHMAFGEAAALLAGDALLTLAFAAITEDGLTKRFPSECILRILSRMATAAGYTGMIGGQAIDLAMEGREATQAQLDLMNRKKTGALISAAAYTGCLLAGASQNEINAALLYAEHLGMAFQMVDDVLDVIGDESALGKPIGSDSAKGKSTYASLLGVEDAQRLALQENEQAKAALEPLPGDKGFLLGLSDMLAKRES